MILNPDSMKPIYIQISEWLESEILNRTIDTNEKIYSQYQLAEMFNINPATAAKGINILADEKVLYKKRGLGMFVAADAKEIILIKRKNTKLNAMVTELAKEAVQLNVSEEELINMIRGMHQKIKGEEK
ncbi:GntR family transcriptional regulator [Fictibacillus barbaricus]|uniref:GntR family transcriptional regulator n=1 Tax=Fictibacillus barbaricus TaxID=182136 RepID=A0ABS2Z8C7_9BACL|nr:GntR family transcriptional regulator [Fictibacillus barbaricus]MBN3544383.1 GntR family transcriptional regulator [Fictibacillus barbaricus]GGB67275.1 GntR family transcriptional regulator [Fictibacillus barbaricus]